MMNKNTKTTTVTKKFDRESEAEAYWQKMGNTSPYPKTNEMIYEKDRTFTVITVR